MTQGNQGPHPADQHRAHAQKANLAGPDPIGRILGARTGQFHAQHRVGGEEVSAVNRDRDVPRDQPARQHHDADVETHDIAHAEQRRRQVGAEVADGLAKPGRGRRGIRDQPQAAAGGQLHQTADGCRARQQLQALAGPIAGAQHLRRGLALGESQALIDDQRSPQGHREQHAQQTAQTGDGQYPRVTEIVPVPQDDQRRHREYHAGGDRRARRSAGRHDVVLQDMATTEQLEYCHRYHGGRNGRSNSHAREQAEIRICGSQNHRQHDRQDNGARG